MNNWNSLDKVFSKLSDTFKLNSQCMARISQSYSNHLVKLFRYTQKEFESLEELAKKREEASCLFYKSYFDLELKKEKSFKASEIGKIVFDTESANLPREELI